MSANTAPCPEIAQAPDCSPWDNSTGETWRWDVQCCAGFHGGRSRSYRTLWRARAVLAAHMATHSINCRPQSLKVRIATACDGCQGWGVDETGGMCSKCKHSGWGWLAPS